MTSPSPEPFPLRWALIVVIAFVAGLTAAVLTFAQTTSWPTALLTGLAATGAATPIAHQLLAAK